MSITIVARDNADFFETDAAQELKHFLGRLCAEPVSIAAAPPAQPGRADTTIYLGDANAAEDASLSVLEPDAIQVRVSTGEAGRIVRLRGGSSRAVRHAAYRFLEACGVLFDLMDDYLPDPTPVLAVTDCDIREKPLVRLRGSHVWINFPMDPSAYSREQWMRYVRGCTRLRYSVLGFHFYNNFPWFDYELDGERKQEGYFFYRHRHPLPEESELRYGIHGNKTMFTPPECENLAEDGAALHAWCQETLRLVMAEAHRQGMTNSVTFEPFAGTEQEAQREKAFLSLKAIVETYPDLDIVKLVSGEGHAQDGEVDDLVGALREFLGGEIIGTDGKEVPLPTDVRWWGGAPAVGLILNALKSAKLSFETVERARSEGVLPDGMQVAIGNYPGCMEALPAIFALIGRVVPDPSIKIHFLPAHGMRKTADAMANAEPAVFNGRQLEISGWTELDGIMYYPQYCADAIEKMRDVCAGEMDIDALYAIHWRVAGVTLSTAFFARCLWDTNYTQDTYWGALEKTFGEEGAAAMRLANEALERHNGGPAGFCYYRCWGQLPEKGRSKLGTPFSSPNELEQIRGKHEQVLALARSAQWAATTSAGRRLSGYLVNKIECGLLHLEYCRLGRQLFAINACAENPDELLDYEQYNAVEIAKRMIAASHEYIRHYQEWMFDRGDEGMLASYYMTATRYAWRYAYPDQDDATGKFCDLSATEAEKTRKQKVAEAGAAVIHAPEQG